MRFRTIRRGVAAAALLAATAVPALADGKPKALMLFSYLGDQSYVRQYNVAIGRAKLINDVQIDVKSGTSRGDVNFFIQAINNATADGYKVIAVNTGATSQELVASLNEANKSRSESHLVRWCPTADRSTHRSGQRRSRRRGKEVVGEVR